MSITESPTWDKFVLKVNNFIFLILYNKYILFTDNKNIVIHLSQISIQICESSTTIKQHNDFHKENLKNIFMLCSLSLYSLNNIIQYYTLFF